MMQAALLALYHLSGDGRFAAILVRLRAIPKLMHYVKVTRAKRLTAFGQPFEGARNANRRRAQHFRASAPASTVRANLKSSLNGKSEKKRGGVRGGESPSSYLPSKSFSSENLLEFPPLPQAARASQTPLSVSCAVEKC